MFVDADDKSSLDPCSMRCSEMGGGAVFLTATVRVVQV